MGCLLVLQQTYAGENLLCNSNDVNQYLEKHHLKHLQIDTKKSRKWAKNYFEILSSKKHNILPKNKKKFKATINATFTNGLKCSFKAKIRVNGDWKDHVQDAPSLIASLDVKLNTGNIDSVVKFKLFLPHTRNADNEIFTTALLRQLGFISPKTYYVPTIFNGVEYTYLFQEKAQKEMLESYQLREGPILVGDERFTWLKTDQFSLDHRLGLARLVNRKWASKGLVSLKISQHAVSLLNHAYLDFMSRSFANNSEAKIGKPPKGWLLDPEILANNNDFAKNINDEFFAIMVALQATHGLRPHNRKFYYDPLYKYLLPIYYDGNSNILDLEQAALDPDFMPNNKWGVQHAKDSIQAIDKNKLLAQLSLSGMKISLAGIDQVLSRIDRNLIKLLKSNLNSLKINTKSYFSKYHDSDKLIAFSNDNVLEIILCNLSLSHCESERHNIADYASILSGRYKNHQGQHYLYIGVDKRSYIKGDLNHQTTTIKQNVQIIENQARLITYDSMEAEIDTQKRIIRLSQIDTLGRAVIMGGTLKNWHIIFEGVSHGTTTNSQRFNENLITGCLTLLDIHLENISISSQMSACEDSVNLIRVNGNLSTINITNAISDALDIDFSNLSVKEVFVSKAGNDCIDVSAGEYRIEKAVLLDCDDKGVSVGEQSKATLIEVNIQRSNIGIAAKDSSEIDVKLAKFQDVTTCFTATKKKQEFWGSKITIQRSLCDKGNNFQQQGSLIEVRQ